MGYIILVLKFSISPDDKKHLMPCPLSNPVSQVRNVALRVRGGLPNTVDMLSRIFLFNMSILFVHGHVHCIIVCTSY
jgi:hypothetical protein